mgnify:FL=1
MSYVLAVCVLGQVIGIEPENCASYTAALVSSRVGALWQTETDVDKTYFTSIVYTIRGVSFPCYTIT